MTKLHKDKTPIAYSLFWSTCRNKNVILGRLHDDMARVIKAECKRRKWAVSSLMVGSNFVSVIVSVGPQVSAHDAVSALKRATARLSKQHASLRRMPSVWTRDYAAWSKERLTMSLSSEIAYPPVRFP